MIAKAGDVPEYFWRSLRFFCYYRLAVALLLVVAAYLYGDLLNVGALDPLLFRRAAVFYAGAAMAFIALIFLSRLRFSHQLVAQVLTDIGVITTLMFASGGQRSGLSVLLLIVIAGAGLVGQGRMTLFFAAVASMAMLFEQGLQTLRLDADPADFFRTGLICLGFFVMAISARLLARRVVANEELARARGRELAVQLAISNRIISDMSDGVLVLDRRGVVRQSNANADRLLGVRVDVSNLRDWAPGLARQMHVAGDLQERVEVVRAANGKSVRLRLLAASASTANPVVYVEDMERIRIQAQQMKLAALGRLTANIAHEVRNPLAAISHAAELLREDDADPQRRRLATIVADNTARLDRLVSEVLELGRRDRAQREAIGWTGFAQTFAIELQLHDASAARRVSMQGDEVVLLFDRGHLYRVLWNLMGNALRHASDSAGAVRLVTTRGADGKAILDVIDDGPGIDESMRGQVFEPFVTSHGSGTGLGLYIARELCEANGASLQWIEPDASASGAHFRIVAEAGT